MRLSYILPRFILLALIWAFFFFAFDPILKWGIRKGMEKAAGAKVEIAGLDTSFRHPSFRMAGVTVGSSDEEYTNALEFSELSFRIAGAPLLEKKFIVDEAVLSGLKFGTPRKTSAKLPLRVKEGPGEPSKFSKELEELKAGSQSFAAERAGDLKAEAAADYQVTPDSLGSVKVYEELQAKYEAQYAELSRKAGSAEYQTRLDAIKAQYEEAGKESDFMKKAKKLAPLQKDIKKLSEDFKNDRKLIEDTASALTEGLKAADEARKKDIEALMGKMKMPALDTQSLAKMLVGPAIAGKTQTALRWLAVLRKHMPDNSQKKVLKAEAGRGRVLSFPKEKTYPSFLIKRMGVTGELGLDVPLDFAGTIEGVTTQPQLYGKPLTAVIKGSKAGRALDFKALIDNTGTAMRANLSLKYSGMAVGVMALGKPDSIGASVADGTGRFDGALAMEGESLKGDAIFKIEGAKVTPQADSIKLAPLKTAVINSMSGLSSVAMGVKIGGTIDSPSLALTTDLAEKLSNAFKGAFGAELAKARAQAQEKVDAALKPYKSKLEALTKSRQKEIQDKLDASQKNVTGSGDAMLNGMKEKAAPAGVPALGKVKLPKFKF